MIAEGNKLENDVLRGTKHKKIENPFTDFHAAFHAPKFK